jgi:hypothetical protein
VRGGEQVRVRVRARVRATALSFCAACTVLTAAGSLERSTQRAKSLGEGGRAACFSSSRPSARAVSSRSLRTTPSQ